MRRVTSFPETVTKIFLILEKQLFPEADVRAPFVTPSRHEPNSFGQSVALSSPSASCGAERQPMTAGHRQACRPVYPGYAATIRIHKRIEDALG